MDFSIELQTEEEKRIFDLELKIEQVKQMGLELFYSYFVKRDVDQVLMNASENFQWNSEKGGFQNEMRDNLKKILQKELDQIPPGCVMKVIRLGASSISSQCYSVSGELEVSIPYKADIVYTSVSFMCNVVEEEEGLFIVSGHSFMSGYSFEEEDMENPSQSAKQNLVVSREQYDYLTGLYTLDYFKDTTRLFLDQTSESAKFALLYTDISNFEKLNNLYGLQKADSVLLELASLISSFHKRVIYCCRSVADHFLILMEVDSEATVQKDVMRLCRDFDATISGKFSEAILRLGVGVFIIQDKKMSVDKMVEHANVARKSLRFPSSRRVAFYDHKVFTQVERVKKIEKGMEKALSDGEFKVYVQPKFDLISRKIVGAEALVRWVRPDRSMIYPDEFIPVFEKNGFISKIDFYMLEQICKWIQMRRNMNRRCTPISVNQSRYLLKSSTYTSEIAGMLRKYNTPPELIELELTERLFSDKLGEMAIMMDQLKKIGIRWSIDDFGTGYSSLNLLKELPVDIIKIDKAFLDETESSETSRIIIRKTVELSKELNKIVVCEGVETEAQADYLREIHCDVAQGYLYARPMPLKEFEILLDNEK